jgi:hypothetical protein
MTMIHFPPHHMTKELVNPIVIRNNNDLDDPDSSSSSSDSSEGEAAVQDMIRRTLASFEMDDIANDYSSIRYDTDDSHEVTRRRWAARKGDTFTTSTGTLPTPTVITRVPRKLRRPVVHHQQALANLPGVPFPDDDDDRDDDLDSLDDSSDDDYSEEVAAAAAEQTRQETVDYFRNKVSQLSENFSVVSRSNTGHSPVSPRRQFAHPTVSPDSVLTFTLANVRKQRTTTTSTPLTAETTVTTPTPTPTPTTPRRSVIEQHQQQDESSHCHYSPKVSSSPSSPLRRGRRLARNGQHRSHNNHVHLAQHVERARASVIGNFSPSSSSSS